ncbi:MAG: TetR/AcrR family transcriptional regulator [Firmicutes bacterium]|nr:TetR/AcrR family transcriptional regulator [Bacillota bacterium]
MPNVDNRPPEMVPETKDRILEAAMLIFGEKGYHNATMAEIAEAAAVGKGTLYWYFSSKENLFAGMIDHGLGLLERKLYAIISDATLSFPNLFKQITGYYLEFAYTHRHLARIFLNSLHNLHMNGELHDQFLQLHNRFNRLNSELIRRGCHEGFLRPDLERERIESALAGLLSAFIGRCILIDGDHQLAAETDFIYDCFINGLGIR